MPRKYPPEVRRQVIELARSGTKVAQLAETFSMSDATIYSWLKQEKKEAEPKRARLTGEQVQALLRAAGHQESKRAASR